MAGDEISRVLEAFRAAIKNGDRVRHIADWKAGTVVGKIHPMYETGVRFDHCGGGDQEPSPVYLKNLYPEWWPAPEWVKEGREGR